MARQVDGVALGTIFAGALFLGAGITGRSVPGELQAIVQGKNPKSSPVVNPITGTGGGSLPGSGSGSTGGSGSAPTAPSAPSNLSANQATGRLLAAAYGWTGTEWNALYDLWQRESDWDNLIMNPSSGAFGIAQALGHGLAGTTVVVPAVHLPGGGTQTNVAVNEYPSAAANGGSATAQIRWGLSYIKSAYGSPSAAWAHETSNGWY